VSHAAIVDAVSQKIDGSWDINQWASMHVDLTTRQKPVKPRLIPNKERAHTYHSSPRRVVGIEVKPKLNLTEGYKALGQCLAFLVEAPSFFKITHPEYRFQALIVYGVSDGTDKFLTAIVDGLRLPIRVTSVEGFQMEGQPSA